jgi:hypothetical protein
MGIRYSIDAFKTKQVLDRSYQKYARPFETAKWWGEYDKNYDKKLVEKILSAFENERERYFDLVHQSDYRDTYRSKNLPVEIYLKHYRVYDAKYSRSTIVRRNIIRRTLAKKSFALAYRLRACDIAAIDNLFYAASNDHHIASEGIYASIAEPRTVPLSYYFEKLSPLNPPNDFTDAFKESIDHFPTDRILEAYGRFAGTLLHHGIRGSHRELFGNTLIRFHSGSFDLLLCDLDVVDAISPYTDDEMDEAVTALTDYLKKRLEHLKLPFCDENFTESIRKTIENTHSTIRSAH